MLLLPRLKSQRANRVEVRFRTAADAGVLLVQSCRTLNVRDDYLLMAVVGGKVEVRYNLGKQDDKSPCFLKSPTLVNDGQWHAALLDRSAAYNVHKGTYKATELN